MWNDDGGRPSGRQQRAAELDLRLPLLRTVGLPWRAHREPSADELDVAAIAAAARAVADRPGRFLLTGGEPLRRRELWEILAEVARLRPEHLGLCTSGQGLTPDVAERLRRLGVRRIQVPFHCARQDAHDWLVGHNGALKTVHRAIRICQDADLAVSAEVVLTRPTMPHLGETVEVLARLGVRAVTVRRLTAWDVDEPELVPLSVRFSLLGPSLEHAAAVALERRVRLRLRDLPLCVAPRLRPLFAAPASEAWVNADGSLRTRSEADLGCATCPGSPQCAGAPRDYVARFGWEELVGTATARVRESVADQRHPPQGSPMTLTWAGPHRVRCETCADTPDGPFSNPAYESTRAIRARLVHAARYRPSVLRLVGADLLAHPQAASLLGDALRLFPAVEAAGEASAIVDWSDLELRRLNDLRRLDIALYGADAASHDAHCGIPGAFAAALRALERVRAKTSIAVGAYAVLHDARAVPAFAEAWSRGALPGAPRFRLSPRGASLDELADCVQRLPDGPARAALMALLPRCGTAHEAMTTAGSPHPGGAIGQTLQGGRRAAARPCGSDPIGEFEPCDEGTTGHCTTSTCPGMAVGWHSSARAQRWSGNSN